jgi:hypothetical protein
VRLLRIDIDRSPDRPAATRLSGVVRYDDPRGGPAEETYWYDVPDAFASSISDSGTPWLAGLLPVAVALGEPLVLTLPVDPLLLDNAPEQMRVWQFWFPERRPVPIEADVLEATGWPGGAARTASFFSGGIDSFHTALVPRHVPVDDLLLVLGTFDLVSGHAASYERVEAKMQAAADAMGKVLVPVTTNQMKTRMAASDPKYLAGGSMLAAVALALERRYTRVLTSSSIDPGWLEPLGGHVLTTPLHSTRRTRFEEEGFGHSRIDKTALVGRSDAALAALRVCFMSGDETNCGECVKCLRTMIALEAMGVLARANFGARSLDTSRVARATVVDEHERYYYEELPPFCRRHGRPDLADAVEHALARSRRHDRFRPFVRWLRRFPVVGPATHRLEALVQDKGRVDYRPPRE